MRIKRPLLYSVIISVFVHLLFFASTVGIKISGVYIKSRRPPRFFDIKPDKRGETSVKYSEESGGFTDIQAIKFQSPVGAQLVHSRIKKEASIPKKSFDIARAERTKYITPPRFDKDYISPVKNSNDVFVSKIHRPIRKDLLAIVQRPSDSRRPVKLEDLLGAQELVEEFSNKMPGFTPKEVSRTVDSGRGEHAYTDANKSTAGIKRKTHPADLRRDFVGDIFIYTDPADMQKYYEVSIRVGPETAGLPRIPKEIVFLVDCSYSIREKRLEEFKQGLKYWLTHLNSEDYFNVMAFKETITKLRPSSVEPTEANIQEALAFVDRMTAGKKTDTYGALYKSIQLENKILPAYIVLFSDGLPTQGMTNSRKIINEISKVNNGKISIFTFSGGMWVNRYLLDFIAYKNRGWSEYSHRTNLIRKNMSTMYEKIRDPLLTNLRYHASGIDEDEMFPKLLPDFFRNIEFTLFGKYDSEDKFSVQLLGDVDGETKEFLIVRSLAGAMLGNKSIARNWAFNKIYHLIGLLEYDKGNEKIINEINFLHKKFNIKTPYASNIKK